MILPGFDSDGQGGRWALSFADLCLVLLAFLVLLQAHRRDPGAMSAGVRQAFGAAPAQRFERAAAPLFQPGEAILQPAARARFIRLGGSAASGGAGVRIESSGSDASARRFDAWELAAARAAAVARAIQDGGEPADRIDLAIDGTRARRSAGGQTLRVVIG